MIRRFLHATATSRHKKSGSLVVGAGSNVIDIFYPVRKLPSPGDKQYFDLEQVGGLTWRW